MESRSDKDPGTSDKAKSWESRGADDRSGRMGVTVGLENSGHGAVCRGEKPAWAPWSFDKLKVKAIYLAGWPRPAQPGTQRPLAEFPTGSRKSIGNRRFASEDEGKMSLTTLKVYTYANCDTCRKAVKWLRAHGLAFDERPIREFPPSSAELRVMLTAYNGEVRRLFNTSGSDYRYEKIGDKLPNLPPAAALGILAGNGNMVKRPFLLGPGVALVGFDEKLWHTSLLHA